MFWKIRDKEISCHKTLLMGIVNITPDSFSDGGFAFHPQQAVARAFQLADEGADIVDLGAESTRPGALPVSEEEELKRLLPVLEELTQKKISIPISIDTTKPAVAKACLLRGAHIINDVSGLKQSGCEMAEIAADFGAGLIVMHRRGNPETMQQFTDYGDLIRDISAELASSLEMAARAGLGREHLAIDPGLGFSKTAEQNLEIMRRAEEFHALGFPVVLGPSRKSFIGKVTGREVSDRDWPTAAAIAWAVAKGIQILRVHEVALMRDVVRMSEAIRGENYVGTF